VSGEVNLLLLENGGFEVERGQRDHGGSGHIANTERSHGERPELEGELGERAFGKRDEGSGEDGLSGEGSGSGAE